VLAILGTLAAIVGPNVFGNLGDAKSATARTQIESFTLALDLYRLHNGAYPTTGQGLDALRTPPVAPPLPASWRGPYLRRRVPDDPWGRPYRYVAPGAENPDSYDLYSLGRDDRPGGEGEDRDVLSWDESDSR
jgi:general secretion pathway protein G